MEYEAIIEPRKPQFIFQQRDRRGPTREQSAGKLILSDIYRILVRIFIETGGKDVVLKSRISQIVEPGGFQKEKVPEDLAEALKKLNDLPVMREKEPDDEEEDDHLIPRSSDKAPFSKKKKFENSDVETKSKKSKKSKKDKAEPV